MASSKRHTLAWDSNGALYSFGDASDGKLGYPSNISSSSFITGKQESFPKRITLLNDLKIIQAACSPNASVLLSSQGQIYTFGRLNHTPSNLIEAMTVRLIGSRMVKVAAGANHMAAIDDTGGLWTWGDW